MRPPRHPATRAPYHPLPTSAGRVRPSERPANPHPPTVLTRPRTACRTRRRLPERAGEPRAPGATEERRATRPPEVAAGAPPGDVTGGTGRNQAEG